jgi:hypothetical protein
MLHPGGVGLLSIRDLADGAATLTGDPQQSPLVLIDLDSAATASEHDMGRALTHLSTRSVVLVGVAHAPLAASVLPLVDAITCTLAPSGAGTGWVSGDDEALDRLACGVQSAPYAALTLANVLPAVARADVPDGLMLESLAYSTLLAGPEYLAWRTSTPGRAVPDAAEPVLISRDGDRLQVTLNRPERRNAFGRAVRDGVIDALTMAELDDTIATIVLDGAGPSFSSGGDLDEFGTAADPAAAHITRLGRSAGLLVHRLRDRVRPVLHGACVGAGIEVPAFAEHVVARDGTWFRLPELSMGLIPGAGGTVSLTHRIGRHRTAFMALTGGRIDLETALAWGLVDARV